MGICPCAAHPIISCILSFIRAHGDNDKDDDLYSRDDDEDSSGVSDTINVIWWNNKHSLHKMVINPDRDDSGDLYSQP